MKNYEQRVTFNAEVAAHDAVSTRGDEDVAVAFLSRWARGGPALELAIGTGRIALPLAATGVRVDGIDISEAMVDELRKRPGGAELQVTLGDFAEVPVEGNYRLIYVVYNTLHNLMTQERQVQCFENVARHLTDDGVFVVEAARPDRLYALPGHQYVEAEAIGLDEVRLDVARFDPSTQMLEESHVSLSAGGIRLNPVVTRQVWPSEMDLMARIAGLRLVERWGGWEGEAYGAGTVKVVSVFGR